MKKFDKTHLKDLLSAHQAQNKNDIEYLHSIFGHVGIEQMIRTVSENDEISEINRQELNSCQCIPCI